MKSANFLPAVVISSLIGKHVACVVGMQPKVSTVKNFRPAVSGSLLYRSATLDELSIKDAKSLLDGSAFGDDSPPLAAVIDLRNHDEILKGKKKRTEGADFFYSSLVNDDDFDRVNTASTSTTIATKRIHVPILRDVNAFWDEAIDRMDAGERIKATMQTAFQGGALDRAAARNLERGGPTALYTVMMATATRPIEAALATCMQESARGPVIFHCQKGKDRTGVLAMLLQSCMRESEEEIIKSYSLSGALLGGEDAMSDEKKRGKPEGSSAGGMIDWSHFRGSPSAAMAETIQWIKQRYGSIENYLDAVSFGENQRETFRSILDTQRNC